MLPLKQHLGKNRIIEMENRLWFLEVRGRECGYKGVGPRDLASGGYR